MAGMAAIDPEVCGSLPGAALVWSPLVPLVLLSVRVAEEGMYGKYHLVLNNNSFPVSPRFPVPPRSHVVAAVRSGIQVYV